MAVYSKSIILDSIKTNIDIKYRYKNDYCKIGQISNKIPNNFNLHF